MTHTPREQRVKVLLPAKMRWEGRWVATSIRNISSRGMMVCGAQLPAVGTYVEVQVAAELITARTVWINQQSCGLQTRNKMDVGKIIRPPAASAGSTVANANAAFTASNQAAAARSVRHTADRNRQLSSTMQYLTFLAIGLSAAGSLGWEIYHTLSAPLKAVEAKLA